TGTETGGRYELKDGAETPDVLQVTYQYAGFILSYESCMLNAHGTGGRTPGKKYYRARGKDDRPHGEAFYGTKGTLFSDRVGFEIFPSARGEGVEPKSVVGRDCTDLHVKDFIDCVRSQEKPLADVEIGHKSTIVAHLGNISYKIGGRKIRWDADREQILNDSEASALLNRQGRAPWNLI